MIPLIILVGQRLDGLARLLYLCNSFTIMNISPSQIQLKISLSEQLNDLLESKAARLGIPVTQFVKHLILKEVENEPFPTFMASQSVEANTTKALEEYDKAIDASVFFNQLNEG